MVTVATYTPTHPYAMSRRTSFLEGLVAWGGGLLAIVLIMSLMGYVTSVDWSGMSAPGTVNPGQMYERAVQHENASLGSASEDIEWGVQHCKDIGPFQYAAEASGLAFDAEGHRGVAAVKYLCP